MIQSKKHVHVHFTFSAKRIVSAMKLLKMLFSLSSHNVFKADILLHVLYLHMYFSTKLFLIYSPLQSLLKIKII